MELKLLHLIGFITEKFVKMHDHMNVKFGLGILSAVRTVHFCLYFCSNIHPRTYHFVGLTFLFSVNIGPCPEISAIMSQLFSACDRL